eukprot:3593268-Prymnesium_polylepis.2
MRKGFASSQDGERGGRTAPQPRGTAGTGRRHNPEVGRIVDAATHRPSGSRVRRAHQSARPSPRGTRRMASTAPQSRRRHRGRAAPSMARPVSPSPTRHRSSRPPALRPHCWRRPGRTAAR